MTEVIDGERFRGMLRNCGSAWRLEHQRDALPFEMPAFQAWQDDKPWSPKDWPEWGEWLEFTASLGGRITRTRLIDNPPTRYQSWGIWAKPWHDRNGDHIRLMPLSQAVALGIIPGSNGWLFDGRQLVIVDSGTMQLVTDEEQITIYRAWRDVAIAPDRSSVPLA